MVKINSIILKNQQYTAIDSTWIIYSQSHGCIVCKSKVNGGSYLYHEK